MPLKKRQPKPIGRLLVLQEDRVARELPLEEVSESHVMAGGLLFDSANVGHWFDGRGRPLLVVAAPAEVRLEAEKLAKLRDNVVLSEIFAYRSGVGQVSPWLIGGVMLLFALAIWR